MRLAKAAELVEQGIEEILSYMSFPREYWALLADEQRLGATEPEGKAQDARGGRLPGRVQRLDAGVGAAEARGRDDMGPAALHEHGPAAGEGPGSGDDGERGDRVTTAAFVGMSPSPTVRASCR